MDVIWFIFHVLNFYILYIHNKTCDAVANLRWKHRQQLDRRSDLPWFTYGSSKCMFANSFDWTTSQVVPTMFISKYGEINRTQKRSPISFKHVSLLLWLFFDPHQTTNQPNMEVQFRRVTKQHWHTTTYWATLNLPLIWSWSLHLQKVPKSFFCWFFHSSVYTHAWCHSSLTSKIITLLFLHSYMGYTWGFGSVANPYYKHSKKVRVTHINTQNSWG